MRILVGLMLVGILSGCGGEDGDAAAGTTGAGTGTTTGADAGDTSGSSDAVDGSDETAAEETSGSSCGDGDLQDGEVCDDGINDGAYGGCAVDCTALAGYCGDAQVQDTEVCDDGINDGVYGGGGCASDCTALAPFCGDGQVQRDEPCDDGNRIEGDGCNVGCFPSGSTLWDTTLGIDTSGALAVAVQPSGEVLVLLRKGQSDAPFLLRYDADGVELESTNNDTRLVAGALRADGSYLVVEDDSPLEVDLLARTAEHALVWSRAFEEPSVLVPRPMTLAPLDGDAVIVGDTFVTTATIQRLDGAGDRVWQEPIAPGAGFVFDLVLTSDDGVAAAGYDADTDEIFVQHRDAASGAQRWQAVLGTSGVEFPSAAAAVAADDDGVVLCWSDDDTIFLARFGLDNGANRSVHEVEVAGTSSWSCYDILLAPGGDVIVGGGAWAGGHRGPRITRVSPEGVVRWNVDVARATSGGIGAIALDAEGNIVVAGGVGIGQIWVAKLRP